MKALMICGILLGVALLLATAAGVAGASIVADSVAEFSGTQGQSGWFYGYFDPTTTPGWASDPYFPASLYQPSYFVQDTVYTSGTSTWSDAAGTTSIWSDGSVPGYWRWAVRRWVSDVAGTIDISGTVGNWNPGNCGNGITARILVDGTNIYEQPFWYTDPQLTYSANTLVNVGSRVDFVIDSRGYDGELDASCDAAMFTAQIDYTATGSGTMSGVVKNSVNTTSPGTPISGATLEITNGPSIASGGNGSYALTLVPGTYTVTVSKIGYKSQQLEFTLTNGQTIPHDFELDMINRVADSVAEFSGTQGQNGWYYGYFDPSVTPGWAWNANFSPSIYQQSYFGQDTVYTIAWGTTYKWTDSVGYQMVWPDGAAPGYWYWAIRRWVSDVAGTLDFSGIIGNWNPGNCGNGFTGRIVVDNITAWQHAYPYTDPQGPFSASAVVNVGSKVDFIVDARGANGVLDASCDSVKWTILIDQIPTGVATVSGVVRDSATPLPGSPLSGATVAVTGGPSITTGSDGSYSFLLAPGNHTITASKAGYQTQPWDFTISKDQSLTHDFELGPTGPVPIASFMEFSGTQGQNNWEYGLFDPAVVPGWNSDPTRLPGIYAAQYFQRHTVYDQWWAGYWRWTTDGGNIVSREGMVPSYWTWAMKRWTSEVAGTLAISGNLGNWNPGIGGNGITARIFVDGVQAWNQVCPIAQGAQPYSANITAGYGSKVDFVVDCRGSDGLLDGSYDTANWTAQVVFDFQQKGAIAGRVTDSASGNPISGASVATTGGTSTTTNANGFYYLALAPAGYTVNVTKTGYPPVQFTDSVTAIGRTTVHNVQLQSPAQDFDRISQVKEQTNGTAIRLTAGKVVTAQTGTFTNGALYIEEPDRSCGVKVVPQSGLPSVVLGDRITLTGVVRTDANTERYIDASSIDTLVHGAALGSLGLTSKWLNLGASPTQLLVRVWGNITYKAGDGSYIYVDDGSILADGSGQIGVRVILSGLTSPVVKSLSAGQTVGVTGLAGLFDNGGAIVPAVRPRGDADVVIH